MAGRGGAGRVYGGLSPPERGSVRRQSLLDAAIDTLIAGEKLTVRGVCTRTGLTSRYFYENFRSTDHLAAAAYDSCVGDIAAAVTAAFTSRQPLPRRIEIAMSALVDQLEAEPRAGHILFSYRIDNQLISRKRQESTAFFAQLTAATASASVRSTVDVGHAAHFVVGGVTQLLSVWLNARYDGAEGRDASDPDAQSPGAAAAPDGATVARIATTMITALTAQLAVELDD